MAISEGPGTTMLVSPSGNGGMGGFGDNGWWIILLFVLLGGFGGYGGNAAPIMNTQAEVQRGFDQASVMSGINTLSNSVINGFSNVQQSLCGGFAGVNATVNNAENAVSQQLYTNEIADLERSFAAQTANSQAINGIQAQLAQCCCNNNLATVQTQNIVQSEGAATRLAIQEQTQAILDKMCQQEIDNLKAQNITLQNQVNMQNLAASQTAQTAALVADNAAQTQYLISKLTPATTTTTTP